MKKQLNNSILRKITATKPISKKLQGEDLNCLGVVAYLLILKGSIMIIDTELIIDHQKLNCTIDFSMYFNESINDNEVEINTIKCGGIIVNGLIEPSHWENIKNRCYLAYHRATVKSMMDRN